MSLWNSTFKNPGKALQRKTPISARKPLISGQSAKSRFGISRGRPKKRAGQDKNYLQACRGELCFIRIPGVCIGGVDTTVPAHSNQARHGKGMGLKAHDEYTVPACHACHAEIDQGNQFTREQKFALWDAAYARWEPVRAAKLNQKQNPATVGAVPGFSSAQV